MSTVSIKNRYTCSSIRRVIDRINVDPTKPGQALHPNAGMLEALGLDPELKKQELWKVWVGIKVGLDRQDFFARIFSCEDDANSFVSANPIGTELVRDDDPWPLDFMELFKDDLSRSSLLFSAGGDPNLGIIYECLYSAGVIYKHNFKITKEVLYWAGQDRVAWAKEREPENWECVIELEYCTYHFLTSSLAYMAAQFHFNYYVTQDDYSAGYLMREIEMILGGAESIAEKTLTARRSAGAAGGLASQSAKNSRLAMFMNEVENLGDLVGRISEQSIVDQAFQNAIERDPALWRQGRGQQAEYETVLRSDQEYCIRYFRIFHQTT